MEPIDSKFLVEREAKYAKVLSDRLREMESLGNAYDETCARVTELEAALRSLVGVVEASEYRLQGNAPFVLSSARAALAATEKE